MSGKKIAVLGAGAIGGTLGGLLSKAGHNVTLIDQWPEHVEAMKRDGVHITTREEEEFQIPVRAMHLHEVCTLRESFDVVFLSVKSYDSVWSVKFIEPYLKPDGVVVPAQNSMNDEWVAPVVGYHRDIPCVVTMTGMLNEPGHILRTSPVTRVAWTLGELHGRITPRVQELTEIMSDAGESRTTTNVWGERWAKLVLNCMSNALAGLTGLRSQVMRSEPLPRRISIMIAGEVVRVGEALGYAVEPFMGLPAHQFAEAAAGRGLEEVEMAIMEAGKRGGPEARASLLQDVMKGRKTEVDYLNGYIVRRGEEAGVPVPANEAMATLIRRVEKGELASDASNLQLLEQKLGPF